MRNAVQLMVRASALAFVVFLVMSASAQMSASAPRIGRPIFQDYFTDGNDAGWVQINRAWHVSFGRYIQDGDYLPDALGRGGYALTHVGDKSWRDYVMEATFDITNAPGLPSPDVHTAWFLMRVRKFSQPGFNVGLPTGGTYYGISIWPRGTSDPRTGCSTCSIPGGLIQFSKHVNGMQVVTIEREFSNAVVGTNSITAMLAGKHIQIWVNGKAIVSFFDSNPIPYGGIGLATTWEAEAWFDNIRVSRIVGHR